MKGAITVDGIDAAALADYAGVVRVTCWPRGTPAPAAPR